MTVYDFNDLNGETRLRATIDPAPGGGSQTLAQVLTTGSDADGHEVTNVGVLTVTDAASLAAGGNQVGQVDNDLPDGVAMKTFGYTGSGNIEEWYDGAFVKKAWIGPDGIPGGTLGGSQTVLVATKHLSAADMATLATVSPVVVAAQGAGKVIVPIGGFAQYNFVSVAYDGGFIAGNLNLIPVGGEAIAGFPTAIWGIQWPPNDTNSTLTYGGTVNCVWVAVPHASDIFAATFVQAGNKGLAVNLENTNPTVGDGTLDLTVLYYIATIV